MFFYDDDHYSINRMKFLQDKLNRMVSTDLLVTTSEFSAEVHQKSNNIDMTHVRSPMNGTTVLLVKRVDCCTLLEQQLSFISLTNWNLPLPFIRYKEGQ